MTNEERARMRAMTRKENECGACGVVGHNRVTCSTHQYLGPGRPKIAKTLEVERRLMEGESAVAIAAAVGVTRQRVSQVKLAAGIAGGRAHNCRRCGGSGHDVRRCPLPDEQRPLVGHGFMSWAACACGWSGPVRRTTDLKVVVQDWREHVRSCALTADQIREMI